QRAASPPASRCGKKESRDGSGQEPTSRAVSQGHARGCRAVSSAGSGQHDVAGDIGQDNGTGGQGFEGSTSHGGRTADDDPPGILCPGAICESRGNWARGRSEEHTSELQSL